MVFADRRPLHKKRGVVHMRRIGKRVGRFALCAALIIVTCCSSAALALTTGVVNSQSGLRLRSGPDTSSDTITVIGHGTTVEVICAYNGWCNVSVNGQTGYMAQEYLNLSSPECAMTGTVNVTAVNLRAAPGTSSNILKLLYQGEQVTILGIEGKWSRVAYNSLTGFIYTEYLSILSQGGGTYQSAAAQTSAAPLAAAPQDVSQPAGTMYITGYGVNFRAEPNTSCAVYEVLPFGTAVTPVEVLDSWTKVSYNGRTGYIYNQYLGAAPDTLASKIIAKAAEYLGTPYVYGGSTPSGFDCSGFTKYVFSFFDYNLNRTAHGQISDGRSITQSELRPGDLVFFSEGRTGYATHVGIYTGNGEFIHSSNRGVVYNNLTDCYYADYYMCAVRVLP